jgi:hypothetical protein
MSGLPDTILKGGHQRTKQSLVPIVAFVITLHRSSVGTQLLRIFSSETTWPFKTKLWWNRPLVITFQNCVRQSRPPTNMVAVTKNKKRRIILAKLESN